MESSDSLIDARYRIKGVREEEEMYITCINEFILHVMAEKFF